MSDDNAPGNSLSAKAPFTPWHRGMSTPNPAGRGKGVPNKFSKAFLHDVSKKWAQHGEDVLEQVRRDDPGLFLRVCASLIRKELLVITHSTTPVQQLSETELQAILVEDVTAVEKLRSAALRCCRSWTVCPAMTPLSPTKYIECWPMVDRKQAAEELLRRQKIRGSMVEWARACGFEPAPHHVYIVEHLEKIAAGELRRLLIAAPPGSAKSTYASVLFPAWYLSQHPGHQIICASHTVELAETFAKRTRNLILEHFAALGIALADDSQAAGRWSLKSGGSLFAVGAGGAIAGYRADLLMIDDPVRSREEAHSESAREKLYIWFITDLLPRLRPGAKVCLISTRWHEDDLAGRLAGSGRYEIINLPAVAEDEDDPLGRKPGEYLWDTDPNYPFGDFLRAQREAQLPSNWSALFMGRPAPESGDFFRAEFFRPLTAMPARETLHIYGASDYAVSAGRGDFTVHVVVGLGSDGTLILLDCWRKQADTATGVEAFLDLCKQWKPIGWAAEKGQLANAIEPFLRQRQRERNIPVAMEMFPTKGDKTVRCQSIRGRLALSGMLVPQVEWWPEVRAELLGFPNARWDDCADSLGLIGQILDRMYAPSVPPPKILSMDPSICNVTLTDLFEQADRRHKRSGSRIA
jgi:predicted phage terminase large subunit-like protein